MGGGGCLLLEVTENFLAGRFVERGRKFPVAMKKGEFKKN